MLKITSKQLEVTSPIRERIESRFEKLSRHDVQMINPHVIITEEKPVSKLKHRLASQMENSSLKQNMKIYILRLTLWAKN